MTVSITHITTSGGLISAAFIENVREVGSRQRGVKPVSFAIGRGASAPWADAPKSPAALEETIAAAWELLLERWDAVRNDLPMMDVSQVRARWLLPLFQTLDFDPVYLRGDTILDEAGKLRYPLSHRGWDGEGAPILHTVAPSQALDARMAAGRGIKAKKSPHDMLQAFLNASTADLWAVLTNGVLLRLLRDYHHTFSKGYVQFDLEAIFETRNYGDFRALYRMCHASRFVAPQTSEVSETSEVWCSLEQFYKDSIATGIKVGEDLRGQVRQAIETLGNGFLDGDLIRRLQQDETLCKQYYGEILHVIYRILFLLFAEQRGMMPGRDSLYAQTYSIAQLRGRAEGDIPREDDFADLWEGLKVTFRMVREGVEDLNVFGYDGMLFDADQTPLLNGRAVRNSDLLRAVRALTLIEREGVLQRISYADLGVEEIGSIYESLLDYTPRITTGPNAPSTGSGRRFFLDPRGSERKTTGSYYTHPSLVNELIKSALLPVMRDRLATAGLPVKDPKGFPKPLGSNLLTDYAGLTGEQRATGEAALLSLKVCDPAAGSGHFLVKANDALGAELARVRSGDEYPTEAQVQAARRDVLARCIYAVDLNPMAVELCKVSLWINASVQDAPLSFLDHHIKCGNSLIGAAPELMEIGIPTDAFKPVSGDDKAAAKVVRARNRRELKEWEAGAVQGRLFQVTLYEPDGAVHREYVTIAGLAEEQPQAARERYAEYLTADDYRRRKLEADFWTAAFFWPLTRLEKPGFSEKPGFYPTHAEFIRLRAEGPGALPPEALAQIETLAEQYRFFHWHLEFPDMFQLPESSEPSGSSGSGFDVVLGNPPWERIKLQEKEFFAGKDADIANARTAAARRKLIKQLPQSNPPLHAAYTDALRESEAASHFLRASGRFPLTSGGDINTYAVFAGLARQVVAPDGRAGLVVPTGIATDYTYREFFADVVERGQLVSLYDFENRRKLFPQVDSRMKFSLLTLVGGGAAEAEYAFFLHTTDELTDSQRRFP
ncbi:MAG: restriction endonuclease, partial [Chloroflexi bacterium]